MISLPVALLAAALVGGNHGRPPAPGAVVSSWYGSEVAGNPMAGGGLFDPRKLTCAHRTLPFRTVLRVRNAANGRTVDVTVTDRGPAAWTGHDLDLSRAAFERIADLQAGIAWVTWKKL